MQLMRRGVFDVEGQAQKVYDSVNEFPKHKLNAKSMKKHRTKSGRLLRAVRLLFKRPIGTWREFFGVDRRSLALARVFVGFAIVLDVLNRMTDLEAHWTDQGVWPRSLVLDTKVVGILHPWWVSLHMMTGSFWGMSCLMVLNLLLAVAFMVGWHTYAVCFSLWVFHNGMFNRTISVMQGGDMLARSVLLWMCLLPMGSCFSFDSLNASSSNEPSLVRRIGRVMHVLAGNDVHHSAKHNSGAAAEAESSPVRWSFISVASVGLLAQFMLMYYTSTVHKTGDEWQVRYSATWLAMQLDFFRTWIGDATLAMTPMPVLAFLTRNVLWWEEWGAVFSYLPLLTGPGRLLSVTGYWLMHFGFTMMMRLGQFGIFACSALLALLPTWFWEVLVFRRLRTQQRVRFRLYYPAACPSCAHVARVLSTFILLPETRVVALSTADYKQLCSAVHAPAPRAMRGFIAQDADGCLYSGFAAKVATWKVSPLLWPLAKLFDVGAGGFRMSAFRIGADLSEQFAHHHELVDLEEFETPIQSRRTLLGLVSGLVRHVASAISTNALGLVIFTLMIGLNALEIGKPNYGPPQWIHELAPVFQIDQGWRMFAPRPPSVHWGYNIKAELVNGTFLELWRREGIFTWEGSPHSFIEDDHRLFHNKWWKDVRNHRWWKYYENGYNVIATWSKDNSRVRLEFGRWICRKYNSRHTAPAEQLWKFEISMISETFDDKAPDEPRKKAGPAVLWGHQCLDSKPAVQSI